MELKAGNVAKVRHEEILPYANWKDFINEVGETSGELGRVLKIVESGQVYRVVGMLGKQKNMENPDIIMTTAHKSKGREWHTVVLADDFPSGYNRDGNWVGLNEMEQNLLYVAITRAQQVCVYNSTAAEMIRRDKAVNTKEVFNVQCT